MYGNFVSRSVRGLAHMLRRPGHGARWVRDRVSKASPLDLQLPWFSWGAIELLDGFELDGRRVFEYGGGGSTLYFLGRGARVRTAENSPAWAELIAQRAKTMGFEQRLDLRVVEMPEHPTAAERALTERYIEQIESEQPYRLIVVDGVDGTPSTRMACLERARRSLEPGGAIVLDDAWRHEYEPAPRVLAGLEQRICIGLGPARWGVTRTDVYFSRD